MSDTNDQDRTDEHNVRSALEVLWDNKSPHQKDMACLLLEYMTRLTDRGELSWRVHDFDALGPYKYMGTEVQLGDYPLLSVCLHAPGSRTVNGHWGPAAGLDITLLHRGPEKTTRIFLRPDRTPDAPLLARVNALLAKVLQRSEASIASIERPNDKENAASGLAHDER